jgi:hypothetical protein
MRYSRVLNRSDEQNVGLLQMKDTHLKTMLYKLTVLQKLYQ